jgi:hypothetical protein
MDHVHPHKSASLETERRPVVDAVSARSRSDGHEQPRQFIALAKFTGAVRHLRWPIVVVGVVFVLNEIKGDARTEAFAGQAQRDIDEIDPSVLTMPRRGHHGDEPAPHLPGAEHLLANLLAGHFEVDAEFRWQARGLPGNHQLHRMPKRGVPSFLEGVKRFEPCFDVAIRGQRV